MGGDGDGPPLPRQHPFLGGVYVGGSGDPLSTLWGSLLEGGSGNPCSPPSITPSLWGFCREESGEPPPLRIMGVSMGGGNVVTPSPQHHPLPIGFLWGQVRSSPHTLWGFYGWGEEW